MNSTGFKTLINELRSLPHETEWVEFKANKYEPYELIGEYVSALANSACLVDKPKAYLVFGIEDKTHKIVGTSFSPRKAKIGNQELENWLATLLSPRIDFAIHQDSIDTHNVVLFEIDAAYNKPVKFKGTDYIRIGSYKKPLSDHPEKERKIWNKIPQTPFETGITLKNQSSDDLLAKIDYPAFFDLLKIPLPDNRQGILTKLAEEKVIVKSGNQYSITNLGAILFTKDLNLFYELGRKAVRVIFYNGNNRLNARKEHVSQKGYAVGFEELIDWIWDQLPSNELIEDALRVEKKLYPKVAIREFVANAIIHQNFSMTGTSPLIEIFESRMEITNPGSPLVPTDRFIDHAPQSRNEGIAALMRRMNICEERGSGIDRAIDSIEAFQLPAPEFQGEADFTRVILFSLEGLGNMTRKDKVRACYQHCCLRWVAHDFMTNASLRERLGIEERNYPMASRIIKETTESGMIKTFDPDNKSNRKSYIPFWA